MFEQDYIMRLIKEMIRMALKLLFQIDTDSKASELLEEKAEKEMLDRLLDLVDDGSINQAENELYELGKHDFSREEIRMGLKEVISSYGLDGIAETFLTEI